MGFAVVVAFLALFMLGFPVVYAILLSSIAYVLLEGLPLGLLAQRITYALDSFPLVAVLLFIFVGNLMNLSGITDRIFRFAYTLVGRVPGGLAQVNVFGSLIFSGMSGAALADIGGLGRIEIDAMKKRGFDPAFAGAVTGASATLGPIFPPSIPLIVYGSVTSVSIVQLLVAGIMPAIFCTALLMLTVLVVATLHKHPRADRWPTLWEVVRDLFPALPAIVAPALMVVGMTFGAFTPTEAAAMTAMYVVLISAVFYRELTLAHLWNSAVLTARSSSAILIIVAAAALFGWILAVEQVPQTFAAALLSLSKDPLMLLIIANLIFFVAGMFLDSTTATLLLVPIIAPPLVLAGVDPVQLGIVTIFNLMLGLLTPPMGLSLFLVSDIAKVSIRQLLRALLPFYIPLLTTLAIPDLRQGFHALAAAHDRTPIVPRRMIQMRIVIGSDHAGFPLKATIIDHIRSLGHEVHDAGSFDPKPVDFPDIAKKVTSSIKEGTAVRGLMVCGTGVGASIAANKVKGIRAAVCHDVHSAHQSVEHDDVNVMCIGAQIVGAWLAKDLVTAYLAAEFSTDEDFRRRVRKLAEMDGER